ncbi:methyltransferase domain-containing protein [Roseospira navarrensis]|uniref:Methyltransferase domain-containing protein n=1 Tax=Roseospira navarrensis TaxID=140058 RepID=A0A7X2D4N0_9PROT|nr:class I SAM-dependent methyltransferase [Roseospira navarrensis]MQX36370.1 methyltransferase domain-containing protein [Roseospira navarrensis]
MPWWTKLGAKLMLSRLPLAYAVWSRLRLFRHGDMDDPEKALETYRRHHARVSARGRLSDGYTVIELGPGDSVLSAAAAAASGAGASILIDAGDFATRDPALFHRFDDRLAARGEPRLGLAGLGDFAAILERLNARYLTQGLASLQSLPDASVDLIWSSVVLEHVPRAEFDAMAREMRRVLKPTGMMSHAIDLRDHLGGGLNNLRFSHARWESPAWRSAGFYTNRLSQAEILAAFTAAGFDHEILGETRWPAPPIPRRKLAKDFRDRGDDALTLAEFDVLAWPTSEFGNA